MFCQKSPSPKYQYESNKYGNHNRDYKCRRVRDRLFNIGEVSRLLPKIMSTTRRPLFQLRPKSNVITCLRCPKIVLAKSRRHRSVFEYFQPAPLSHIFLQFAQLDLHLQHEIKKCNQCDSQWDWDHIKNSSYRVSKQTLSLLEIYNFDFISFFLSTSIRQYLIKSAIAIWRLKFDNMDELGDSPFCEQGNNGHVFG